MELNYRAKKTKVSKTAKLGLLIAFLVLNLGLTLWQPGVSQAAETSRYFPETGFTVSGKFLLYWTANGGLPVYGYPISDAKQEVDPETGKTFLTQWFERNRFELHPENAGTKYEVLLGLLGKDLRREALTIDPDFQPASALANSAKNVYFKETSHNLSDGFLSYWQNNGGLERFGFPISEVREEVDPETGKVFKMQWFERARFEYHPENTAPYDILLGLLGKQLRTPTSKLEFSWKKSFSAGELYQGLVATDKQGNFYVASNKTTVQRYDSQGRLTLTVDTAPKSNTQAQFDITDFDVDNQGNIYVAQYGFAPIPGGIVRGTFIKKFDANGEAVFSIDPGGPAQPVQLAVTSVGNIYIATSGNYIVLDTNGKLVLNSEGAGCLVKDIAATREGTVYLACDRNSGLIKKFDTNGKATGQLGGRGTNSGQFNDLRALAVDSQGNLYALDGDAAADAGQGLAAGNSRITKFDNTGKVLFSWGNQGSANGQFKSPGKLSVDTKSNLYLADSGNNRLQKFRQP